MIEHDFSNWNSHVYQVRFLTMRNTYYFRVLRTAKNLSKKSKKKLKGQILAILDGVGTAATHRANTYRKPTVPKN